MNSAVLAEDENRKIILVNQMFCDLFQVPLTTEQMAGADCSGAAEQSKYLFKQSILSRNFYNDRLYKYKIILAG